MREWWRKKRGSHRKESCSLHSVYQNRKCSLFVFCTFNSAATFLQEGKVSIVTIDRRAGYCIYVQYVRVYKLFTSAITAKIFFKRKSAAFDTAGETVLTDHLRNTEFNWLRMRSYLLHGVLSVTFGVCSMFCVTLIWKPRISSQCVGSIIQYTYFSLSSCKYLSQMNSVQLSRNTFLPWNAANRLRMAF